MGTNCLQRMIDTGCMTIVSMARIVGAVLVLAYGMNTLITVLPQPNRYKRFKKYRGLGPLLGMVIAPLRIWPTIIRTHNLPVIMRHIAVLILAAGMVHAHAMGYVAGTVWSHYTVLPVLTVCLFTDIRHHIIPNELSFGLIFFGVGYAIWNNRLMDGVYGMGIVIAVFVVFSVVMRLMGQSQAFGAGDIKLCLGLGIIWGWQVTAIMLYFSFLVSGVSGFYFLMIQRRSKTSYMAFAPAIIAGFLMALVFTDTIFDHYYPWINHSFKPPANGMTMPLHRP